MPEQRLPPQNVEAERSVLGALLIDKDAIVKVAEFLRPEHFYKDSHGRVYTAILSLYEKREPADMVTVPDELQKKKLLDKVGGLGYLSELATAVPTATNIEYYGRIVKDNFVKRELIASASRIAEMGYDVETECAELVDKAEQSLFKVSQDFLREYFVPIKQTLEASFDRLEELHQAGEGLRGVPTGFKTLDQKLSGLQESNLLILAARPSVGKSSMASNIAQHAAVEHKVPVGIFSLEMSREQLVDRMLSAQADADAWRITTGNLEEEDFARIGEAMGELAEAPIFIDDTPGLNILEMRTKARRLQMEHGVKLFIVDYLQLLHGRGLENRVQEVSEISQALKNMARELKVPVLACAQLSRAIESRTSRIPQLSDLRESGSIEQESDVVMFLYRPDEENRSEIKLLISKHRNGPTGEIDMYFRGERTKFYEAETVRGG
jgi:replicative DNA helicase